MHLVLTCVCYFTGEGTSLDGFSIEFDVDCVGLSDLWCEVDEAATSAQDLNVVGDLTVVDANLKLTLSGCGRVNPENKTPCQHPSYILKELQTYVES